MFYVQLYLTFVHIQDIVSQCNETYDSHYAEQEDQVVKVCDWFYRLDKQNQF